MRLTKSHVISGVLALALLGATGAAWYFAAQARTPAQRAEDTEEPDDSVVSVRVDQGQLVDTLEFEATLDRTGDFPVAAPTSAEDAEVALVSKIPVKVGDEVKSGTVLLEVSGRPMIALLGEVPAYRDLEEGDEGPDVEQLQKALAQIYGTPTTGKFDDRTVTDLKKLYDSAGYQVATTTEESAEEEPAGEGEGDTGEEGDTGVEEEPAGEGQAETTERVRLPASEVVFVPETPMQVGKIDVKQSAPVSEGNAMTLVSGDWKLEAELEDEAASELSKYGEDAELEYTSGPLEGLEVGVPELETREVEDTEGEEDMGMEGEEPATVEKTFAVFEFDEKNVEDDDELVPGTEQEVSLVRARSAEDALIVPLSALWTDSGGKTMVTLLEGEEEKEVNLEVEVSLRHDGRGVIEAVDGDIAEGDKVVIAWRDRENG